MHTYSSFLESSFPLVRHVCRDEARRCRPFVSIDVFHVGVQVININTLIIEQFLIAILSRTTEYRTPEQPT